MTTLTKEASIITPTSPMHPFNKISRTQKDLLNNLSILLASRAFNATFFILVPFFFFYEIEGTFLIEKSGPQPLN